MKQIAFDRSNRVLDEKYGYLRVSDCVITAESVDEYLGVEIPDWEELGLDPDRLYAVYRPLDELEAALDTFAGLPLLYGHKADSAENPLSDKRVGAVMNDQYIRDGKVYASISVQKQNAIESIQDGSASDLSAAYTFVPVLESGKWNGLPYDIRMTQIHGNHVALVPEGRVEGAQVADAKPMILKGKIMSKIGTVLNELKELLTLAGADKDEKRIETAQELGVGDNDDPTGDDEIKTILEELYALRDQQDDEELASKLTSLGDRIRAAMAEESEGDLEERVDEELGEDDEVDVEERREKALTGDSRRKVAARVRKSDRQLIEDGAALGERRAMDHLRKISAACRKLRPIVGDIDPFSVGSVDDVYRRAIRAAGKDPSKYSRAAYEGICDVLVSQAAAGIAQDWAIGSSAESASAVDKMPAHLRKTHVRGKE